MSSKGVLVKNLTGKLAEMTKRDIHKLFEAFGHIASVDVDLNPLTGKNQGFAIVMFEEPSAATNAIKAMNGYLVSGSPIEVNQLSSYLAMGNRPSMVDDEARLRQKQIESKKLIQTQKSKYSLPDAESESDSVVKTLIESIRQNRFYVEEPTRVVGLFNLFDIQDESLCRNKRFLETLVSDVESFVNSIAEVRESRMQLEKTFGIFLLFRRTHNAKDVFKELQRKMFDKRAIVCAFFEEDVMDRI